MTKKQRERMKTHRLIRDDRATPASHPWINNGAVSVLMRCQDCDWLGWFPAAEIEQ